MLRPAQLALSVDHPKGGDIRPGQIFPQSVTHLSGISGLAAEHGDLPVGRNLPTGDTQADKPHFFVKRHDFPTFRHCHTISR